MILVVRVEPVLNGDDFVTVSLQCGNYFAEARAIGPDAVTEDNGGFF